MKRVVGECPLGSKCEQAEEREISGKKEMVLVTCPWFVELRGKDATGQDQDSFNCAVAWMPILQVEMAGTNRGQTAAIESLRNETVKRQDAAIQKINEHRAMK